MSSVNKRLQRNGYVPGERDMRRGMRGCGFLIAAGGAIVAPGAVGKMFDPYPGTGRGRGQKKK